IRELLPFCGGKSCFFMRKNICFYRFSQIVCYFSRRRGIMTVQFLRKGDLYGNRRRGEKKLSAGRRGKRGGRSTCGKRGRRGKRTGERGNGRRLRARGRDGRGARGRGRQKIPPRA